MKLTMWRVVVLNTHTRFREKWGKIVSVHLSFIVYYKQGVSKIFLCSAQ